MSRINLPEDILLKMTCLNCKNFLSLYPVYTKKDATGAFCGRCKPTDEDLFLRDEAYELLSQFLLFPCIYNGNGCQKHFVPSLIEQHEPICEYRKFVCPSVAYTKCKWEGPHNVLYTHFSEKHPALLIEEQKFEIDFANSIEEKLLMKVNDDLFIIKKDVDARKELFLCNVEHLKSLENTDTYNFKLRIDSNNRNYSYKCPERAADGEDTMKLTGLLLKETLQEPPSMIVIVSVMKATVMEDGASTSEGVAVENVMSQSQSNSNVDWGFLSELECPVCYEYMLPPIYQCATGHSICKTCKPKVNNICPTCKNSIGITQNFVLEKMTQLITYPCKHHKLGCQVAFKATEIEAHESNCEYGPFECPLKSEKNCQWNGSNSEVLEHVESLHRNEVLKNEKIELPYAPVGQDSRTYLITTNKKVFKFCYKYENHFCQWSMQIVGSKIQGDQFKFEIDLFDSTGGKKRFFISGPVVPLRTPINNRNCIRLADETVNLYADDKLTFYVKLSKENC